MSTQINSGSSLQSEKPSLNSSTSQSSIKLKLESKLKESRQVTRKEVEVLNEKVKNEVHRNRRTYDNLISLNPYFSMKLYSPLNNFTSDQVNSSSIEVMLKQHQLLLEDGHLLEKELMKARLRKMQQQHRQHYDVTHGRHHYAYLRKIWLNPNECESNKPIDTIEQLNKKVVIIKNNILGMTETQKVSQEHYHPQDQYEHVQKQLSQTVHEMKDYVILRQKYQNLRMSFEDLVQQLQTKTSQLQEETVRSHSIIDKVKQDNEQLRKHLKDTKQKLLQSQLKEANLLAKIQKIESVNRTSTDTSRVSPSKASPPNNSDILDVAAIKWAKLDPAKFELKINTQFTSKKDAVELAQPEERFEESPIRPPAINKLDQSGRDLEDVRSVDGKKGRFVRMRSPAAGKLLKGKEPQPIVEKKKGQMVSPSIKEIKEKLVSK